MPVKIPVDYSKLNGSDQLGRVELFMCTSFEAAQIYMCIKHVQEHCPV